MKKIIILLTLFSWSECNAQITTDDRQAANTFFTTHDWSNAKTAYEKICVAEPTNWQAKNRLGVVLSELGNTKNAISTLEDAIKLSNNNAQPIYHLARTYAKSDDSDKAFKQLDLALTNGFAQLSRFENDAMLTSLIKDARYEAFHERLKQAVIPCRYNEVNRQFDFWIGEWNVVNAAGQLAGKSSIQLILGDCIIYENWTSAPPNDYSGKSFNLHNASTNKWMQTWVDDKGGLIEYIDGYLDDGNMIFFTKPDQNQTMRRLTFFNLDPNQVRQFSELSNDDGKTWTTEYDFYYNRIK